MTVPGVVFERVDLNRPRVARLRTDICGFLGYTERGPVDRPVKLESWRQFLDAFGPPPASAHTGHAVRLFFDNGGAACHMMRVTAAGTAVAATLDLGGAATMTAAFSVISGTDADTSGPTSAPAAVATASPGSWGNRLTVTVERGGMGSTRSLPDQPADGTTLRVETIAGFQPSSWVRVVQDADVRDAYARIAGLDPQLREITWSEPLTGSGLDFARPIRLETVEFTLRIDLDGEQVARHADLSLDPDHPRRIDRVLAAESALVAAVVHVDPADLADPARWPEPGLPQRLSGGRDGLATVTGADFRAALDALEPVDEISVLAAPDLVLRAVAEDDDPGLPPAGDRCAVPEPPPAGRLTGLVVESGTDAGLAGVRVATRDGAASASTDAAGRFSLRGLPVGQVALRLQRAGSVSLEVSAQSFLVPPPLPQRFELAPRSSPPALVDDEILAVQTAMAAQGERGGYRVAVLDPPEGMLGVEEIQSWRSRFDTSYAALYWPWVVVAPPGERVRTVPPSGAVAGLIARMDLLEGPHRAAANRPLRGVAALSRPVDDGVHGLLNELGINVLRATPGQGIAPQGARTLSSAPELRHLGVRRLLLMIAESIEDAHPWAVFEPNNHTLRAALTQSLTQFLAGLHRRGVLAGDTTESAFAVKCDAENNPAAVIDAGRVVADVAVAPVRPYEFVRLRLGRTDRLTVRE